MATPLSASAILSALKAEGVAISEYGNWKNHNRNSRGAWGPVYGVMIHHTVSSQDDSSVALCYNGHSSLPGPLCHSVGRNDGVIAMVGHGRANHAGSGDKSVLNAVVNETTLPSPKSNNTDGNAHFYGLEIVNLGDNKDTYTTKQYDAAVKWAAALCRAHNWGSKSVIGHKEWQLGKIDPRGPIEGGGSFDMNKFRSDVQKRLDASNSTPELPETGKEDSPMHLYFERKNGVTLNPGEWYTITWDRVYEDGKGWSDRSLAQTLLKGAYYFSLDFAVRAEGMDKGQELQMRVARNHRKPGQEWARAKSWPINSPVHDGGRGHFTHHWQGHLPGTDDNRLVADILVVGDKPIKVDDLTASLLYWKA